MATQFQVERFLRIVDELPSKSQVGRLWFLITNSTKKLYGVFSTDTFTEIASAADSGTVVDAEVPSGTVDGANLTFTLAHAPNPVASLRVYVNGLRKVITTEYTLAGTILTMDASVSPLQSNDTLVVSYRY